MSAPHQAIADDISDIESLNRTALSHAIEALLLSERVVECNTKYLRKEIRHHLLEALNHIQCAANELKELRTAGLQKAAREAEHPTPQ